MRFRVRINRVQILERSVTATDEEAAVKKIEAELDRPYGLFGPWNTQATEIEILGQEPSIGTSVGPVGDGPMLLSIKDAAKHLGISYGTLYQLLNGGELEYVRLGRRKLISRAALNRFIETNTTTGYTRYSGARTVRCSQPMSTHR